jgi:hypothetical protein
MHAGDGTHAVTQRLEASRLTANPGDRLAFYIDF